MVSEDRCERTINLTVKVLEVGQLDALLHTQDVGCSAQAVEHHPQVSSMQSRNSVSVGRLSHAGQSVLDVCPCGNDGAQDHQSEGEKCHRCHCATEPKDLSVCDQDDGQVLEDGVDGNREEFHRPCARVDHADEEERNREPCGESVVVSVRFPSPIPRTFLCLVAVEISVRDEAGALGYRDGGYADDGLHRC